MLAMQSSRNGSRPHVAITMDIAGLGSNGMSLALAGVAVVEARESVSADGPIHPAVEGGGGRGSERHPKQGSEGGRPQHEGGAFGEGLAQQEPRFPTRPRAL